MTSIARRNDSPDPSSFAGDRSPSSFFASIGTVLTVLFPGRAG